MLPILPDGAIANRHMVTVDRARVRQSWGIVVRNKPPLRGHERRLQDSVSTVGSPLPTVPTVAKVRALRLELAAAEQQQRDELLTTIATTVGVGVTFRTIDLWRHRSISPALRQAIADLEIGSRKQLGKWLRQLPEQICLGLSVSIAMRPASSGL